MRRWARATFDLTCNRCGAVIAAETPLQWVTLPGLRRQLARCLACADGPPSADLPLVIGATATGAPVMGTVAMTSTRQLAMAFQRDWKMRQAEPEEPAHGDLTSDEAPVEMELSQADAETLAAAYQAAQGVTHDDE